MWPFLLLLRLDLATTGFGLRPHSSGKYGNQEFLGTVEMAVRCIVTTSEVGGSSLLSVLSEMPVGDCPVRSNGGSGRKLGPDDKTARLCIVGTVGGGEAGSCNLRTALDFRLCNFFIFLIIFGLFLSSSP